MDDETTDETGADSIERTRSAVAIGATPLLAGAMALLLTTAAAGAVLVADSAPGTGLHAAAGRRGWLVLVVLSAAVMVMGDDRRERAPSSIALVWAPIAAVTVHAAASWTASPGLRAAAAVLALAAGIGFVAALRPWRFGPVTVPALAIAAAVVMAVTGYVFDLAEIARPESAPFQMAGAATPTVTVLSVVLGAALAEWGLNRGRRGNPAGAWGMAQVGVFVIGWLTLLLGTATESLFLLVASVMFHLVAVSITLARIAPRLSTMKWSGSAPGRWFGLATLFLAAHLGLVAHVALGVAAGSYPEVALVPRWLAFAVDHAVFVGLVGCGFLGMAATARPGPRWAGHAAFAAVPSGLVGFVIAIAAGLDSLAIVPALVMGSGIVLAAVAFAAPARVFRSP